MLHSRITMIQIRQHWRLKLMLGNNLHRRQTQAAESIARSSEQIAESMRVMAAAEREKTLWLREFFRWFQRNSQPDSESTTRRYNGGGGMRDGTELPPLLPRGPGGIPALPDSAERPCINVTPSKAEKTRRKWLW